MLVVKKENAMVFNIKCSQDIKYDVRDSKGITWRDLLVAVLEDSGELSLSEIYALIDGHKKAKNNSHWKEKVRQTLRKHANLFECKERGRYAMVA